MLRILVLLGTLATVLPLQAAAQCWECELHLYPGNDCWMDGCTGTWEHGHWDNCAQHGDECDFTECETYGGICDPWSGWPWHLSLLLDGRAPLLPVSLATATALSWGAPLEKAREEEGVVVRPGCSQAVMAKHPGLRLRRP
jgi:hypothetical protein